MARKRYKDRNKKRKNTGEKDLITRARFRRDTAEDCTIGARSFSQKEEKHEQKETAKIAPIYVRRRV